MVDLTWEEIEEFQEQLKKLNKNPDITNKWIEFLTSKENIESMKLFYKVYFEKRDEVLSREEKEELLNDFETKLTISNIKFASYFPKD
ncbi:MAG: hypothetical protein ACXVHS_05045 [Methanobacterium sp.]